MKTFLKKVTSADFAKLSFFLFVLVLTILIFVANKSLLPSTLLSILLFFIFSPFVNALERRGLAREVAIVIVFLVCGAGLAFATSVFIPRVTTEIESVSNEYEKYMANIKGKLFKQERELFGNYPLLANSKITDKVLLWVETSAAKLLKIIPDLASSILMILLLVPFFTFILLKDASQVKKTILSLVPNQYFETVYSLISKILDEIGGYVAARIVEAILVSLMVTVSCMVLGVPYAILIGIFAGATNPIPYLGPLIGALPGILLAIIDPSIPNQLLIVSMVYLAANVIDTVLIFPLMVAKIVNLHPLIVIICVIIGSQIFGIVGMIIAVPITSILKIFIQEIYTRIYLRDA